jgi:hypothetical protein
LSYTCLVNQAEDLGCTAAPISFPAIIGGGYLYYCTGGDCQALCHAMFGTDCSQPSP